jgi:hypothetical protein
MSPDPYQRCGLLGNPFVAEPARPWAEPGWADRAPAQPLAPGQGLLVQFIGVKGAGKSTTLNRFRSQSPGPHRYVPPGPGRWRPLPVAPLVYWDELDRSPRVLRRVGWLRAARIRATVVAGTHVDLAAEAGRVGLSVQTVELPPISIAELTTWAEARLAASRLSRARRPESTLAGCALLEDRLTEAGGRRSDGAGVAWLLPRADAARITTEAGASWRRAADLMHIWVAEEVARRSARLEVGYGEDSPYGR